jgi:hypothetical protein
MKVNGQINFYGLTAQQHPRDLLWWGRELHRIDPARIVVLGVGFGGFEVLFSLYAWEHRIPIDIYDLAPPKHLELLDHLGCRTHLGDLFHPRVSKAIARKIAATGRTILLCDAVKKREFDRFAPSLKPGDVCGVHDFEPRCVKNGWRWPECSLGDIRRTCDNYNIVPYRRYDGRGAWGVFMRKEQR